MNIRTILLFLLVPSCFSSFLKAQPTLAVTATATPSAICEGSQTTLQALPTGGSGAYTYSWESNPAGTTSNIQSPIVSPTITTVYTVTVDDGSETASASVTVLVNHVPGAVGNISGQDTVCQGSSNVVYSVASIPDAASYVWNLPPGVSITYLCQQAQISANFSAIASSGMISVYGVNACGVGPSSSMGVTVNQTPIVNAGIDQFIAYGTTATLNGFATGGSGSYSYSWTPAALLQNANVQNPTTIPLTSSTVFTLTVTDSATGCTGTDNVHIIVSGAPPLSCTAIANPAIICQGSCTTLQAIPSGGSGAYTYTWTSNPPSFTSTLQSPVVCPTVTTPYILVVSDGSQTVSASVTVQVIPLPGTLGAITGLTDVCAGTNNVVYTVPTSPVITYYFWSLPAGATVVSGQNTSSIVVHFGTNAVSGNITAEGWSACGCVQSDTLAVTLHSPPIADAGPNQNINCGGAPVSIGTTAVSGMVYSWSPSYALSNPNIAQPTALPWGNTTYILSVTDTSTGCFATDTVSFTVIGAPVANAGSDQSINCGGPGVVIGSASVNGIVYSWTPATGLSDDSIAQPIATPQTTTNYNLMVLDVATGCFDTDDITVTVNAGPTADAGTNQTISIGNTITLNGSATGGSGNYSYFWMPDTLLQNPNIPNPATFPLSSPVVFTLLVTDTVTGCTASDSVLIDVIVSFEKLPESFTALFYPNPTTGIITIEMNRKPNERPTLRVFSPIGKIIYSAILTNDMHQRVDLSTLPDGLYFITIEAYNFSVTKKVVILKGNSPATN